MLFTDYTLELLANDHALRATTDEPIECAIEDAFFSMAGYSMDDRADVREFIKDRVVKVRKTKGGVMAVLATTGADDRGGKLEDGVAHYGYPRALPESVLGIEVVDGTAFMVFRIEGEEMGRAEMFLDGDIWTTVLTSVWDPAYYQFLAA